MRGDDLETYERLRDKLLAAEETEKRSKKGCPVRHHQTPDTEHQTPYPRHHQTPDTTRHQTPDTTDIEKGCLKNFQLQCPDAVVDAAKGDEKLEWAAKLMVWQLKSGCNQNMKRSEEGFEKNVAHMIDTYRWGKEKMEFELGPKRPNRGCKQPTTNAANS